MSCLPKVGRETVLLRTKYFQPRKKKYLGILENTYRAPPLASRKKAQQCHFTSMFTSASSQNRNKCSLARVSAKTLNVNSLGSCPSAGQRVLWLSLVLGTAKLANTSRKANCSVCAS